MNQKFAYVASLLTLLLAGGQCLAAPAAEPRPGASEIELLIDTADTYFWFGISERGNLDAFDKAAGYLKQAKNTLKISDVPEQQAAALRTRIEQARRDLAAQREVHFDTLYSPSASRSRNSVRATKSPSCRRPRSSSILLE